MGSQDDVIGARVHEIFLWKCVGVLDNANEANDLEVGLRFVFNIANYPCCDSQGDLALRGLLKV